jgi:hypothetical protein
MRARISCTLSENPFRYALKLSTIFSGSAINVLNVNGLVL